MPAILGLFYSQVFASQYYRGPPFLPLGIASHRGLLLTGTHTEKTPLQVYIRNLLESYIYTSRILCQVPASQPHTPGSCSKHPLLVSFLISSILFGYSIPNSLYLCLTNYSCNLALSPLVSPPSYEVVSSLHSCHPSQFKPQSTCASGPVCTGSVCPHSEYVYSQFFCSNSQCPSNHKHQRQGKTFSVLQSPQ